MLYGRCIILKLIILNPLVRHSVRGLHNPLCSFSRSSLLYSALYFFPWQSHFQFIFSKPRLLLTVYFASLGWDWKAGVCRNGKEWSSLTGIMSQNYFLFVFFSLDTESLLATRVWVGFMMATPAKAMSKSFSEPHHNNLFGYWMKNRQKWQKSPHSAAASNDLLSY